MGTGSTAACSSGVRSLPREGTGKAAGGPLCLYQQEQLRESSEELVSGTTQMTGCQLPLFGLLRHQQLQEEGSTYRAMDRYRALASTMKLGDLTGYPSRTPSKCSASSMVVTAWLRHPDIPSGFRSQPSHTSVSSSHAEGMKKPAAAFRNVLCASTQKPLVFVICCASC